MEDDFPINENAEGVDEEMVKAIVAGKKKELDAREAFGIFDVCEELDGKTFRKATTGDAGSKQTGGRACSPTQILNLVLRCGESVLPR